MKNDLNALMSLVKDKDEFFEEENKELNTLLRGVSLMMCPMTSSKN